MFVYISIDLRDEWGKVIASINFPTSADRNEHGSEDSAPKLSFLSPFCFSELENVKSLIANSIQKKSPKNVELRTLKTVLRPRTRRGGHKSPQLQFRAF